LLTAGIEPRLFDRPARSLTLATLTLFAGEFNA